MDSHSNFVSANGYLKIYVLIQHKRSRIKTYDYKLFENTSLIIRPSSAWWT